jgi:hypothetical protein
MTNGHETEKKKAVAWLTRGFGAALNFAPIRAVRVIKIIHSVPIRIIDRISLLQRCYPSIGVSVVQGLARR